MTKAKKSAKAEDPRGKFMTWCPEKSLFKLKIYKKDGREGTYFSNDFEKERKEFNDSYGRHMIITRFKKLGPAAFEGYNGYVNLENFVNKICEQDNLKFAQLYCNQIREPNPRISTDPVPIVLCNYADPRAAASHAEETEDSLNPA